MRNTFFTILLLLLPGWVAAGPLRSIVVFGNEKTERKTILDIIGVEPQTFINAKLVKDVDDRLVNSGLFKTVRVTKYDNRDGTSDLRIWVVEKQLWFVFPSFRAWSGRYSGGVVLGESNLFSPGARSLAVIEGGNKLNRVFGVFDAKSIFDTNYAAQTWFLARDDDVPLYNGTANIGEINMRDVGFALKPGYQWTNDIRTSLTTRYKYVWYGETTVPPVDAYSNTEGNDVAFAFEFVFDSLRRREAFLAGHRFRASFEFSEPRFGSDFTYHVEEVEYRYALRFWKRFNYVLAMQGAIGDTLPFHQEFTLGGVSLRGYDDRQFRGDTEVVARQDVQFSLFRNKTFSTFGAVFFDSGLLYRDADGLKRENWRNGTGGGIRVSLADILAPVFGLDFAYGIEDDSFQILFALGLVDF